MKTLHLLAILILLFLPIVACQKDNNSTQINNPKINIDTVVCTVDNSINYNEYKIINNCWGKGNITNFTQCVFLKENDGNYNIGFNWMWQSNNNNNVKAYPEILFGFKPFESKSTTNKLPIKLSLNKKIIASYSSITVNFTGKGNTSFDIWITSSSSPNQSNITREIMIWTQNYGQQPGGSKIASVNIDNVNFDFYKADWNWTYLAFVIKDNLNYQTVNIHKFLEYLISNGYIKNDEYLASVEFGNEIIEGFGNTTITNYKVVIE